MTSIILIFEAKVSLKPFSSVKHFIEFYNHLLKGLDPKLECLVCEICSFTFYK